MKNLPIIPISAGDISYEMMLFGRGSHCSHKCLHCDLCRTGDHSWQNNESFELLFTLELIQEQIDQYIYLGTL